MSITFRTASNVPVKKASVGEGKELLPVMTKVLKDVEACAANRSERILPCSTHPFLEAFHISYAFHVPLVLNPDDVWLVIAQGFAFHVNANAEALRSRFVQHQGQKEITIRRNDFAKGSPNNDWPACFGQFSDAIAEHIGEKQRDLVVNAFSTTGSIEKAASNVVLMDAMRNYFKYRVMTMCAIPEVIMEGSLEDWQSIRNRAAVLSEYGLEWWTNKLLPVLDGLIASYQGNASLSFWENAYKRHGGSGGDRVSGWVNVFFPYIENFRDKGKHNARNTMLEKDGGWGVGTDSFHKGLCNLPFVWEFFGAQYKMEFAAGFVGTSQDPDSFGVRPVIGWAICNAQPEQAEDPDSDLL